MKMTIDEALEGLCFIQEVYNDDIAKAMFIGFNDKDNESIEVAISTMRKYQKIEQIHQDWFKTLTSAEVYTKISEVLNGNDD